MAREVERLVKEFIPRLGQKLDDGRFGVKFGTLFDDDEGQQYFEAIVGTLKAAKRRKLIDFKGQMLLKGEKVTRSGERIKGIYI